LTASGLNAPEVPVLDERLGGRSVVVTLTPWSPAPVPIFKPSTATPIALLRVTHITDSLTQRFAKSTVVRAR